MSTIYQLKIELAESHPKIWRRLTVPSDTPFDQLHDIIQISMGWRDEYPMASFFACEAATVKHPLYRFRTLKQTSRLNPDD